MMNRWLRALSVLGLVAQVAWAAGESPIDRKTLDRWSAPYRGWYYWPEPIIASEPEIPGHETFHNTDVPCVYQMPGQPEKWYMSFIAFNGHGYNSFVAESNDLIHWKQPRLAMGFGKPGEFDHGGCVIGAFLYDSYDIRAPRVLKRRDGKFWTLYGCYPRQGGYELRPGYEGVAISGDGLIWRRAKDQPILSVSDADCGAWEKSCIYQPWLVEHEGKLYDFYNAAQGGVEQTGLALSTDLLSWKRYAGNPIIRVRLKGYDERFASDPKVFRDGDHWTMFYFGVGRGGAHIMVAFSRDLLHWTAHPEPLYKAGGHPGGLDKTYAHKISLVYRPESETFYMYYCAVGSKGRCIGLITSKRLDSGAEISTTRLTTDWPHWRGPNADSVADGRNLPIHWSQTKNVRWSVKLPGWGTSSPVVYRGRVFVTSQRADGVRKSLLTLCFDQIDGRELWRHDFGFGVDQRTNPKSNLAANTPAVTEDAVYIAFGNADVARYSHEGKLIWVTRYIPRFGDPKMAWGYNLSPLVLDDAVLFPWDHHTGPCFLIGLDKRTGQIAWQKDRPIGTAHATPLLVEHHGQTEILVPGKNRLTAFDAKTHAELWRYGEGEGPFNGEIIVSPVYGDGMIFLQLWRQSPIHAIRLSGNGKLPAPVWVSEKPGPQEPSLLYYRGLLYALMDNGVLVCLDGKTGKEHYRQRLGGPCNSSPVASDGRIYASNNEGTTFVVRAGEEFALLGTNELGERITASPAISGNELIYRTDSHLYCVGQMIREP